MSGPLFGPIFFHHSWLRNTGPPLLEGKFFEEDVFGFWSVLAVPAARSQKWDRRLHLLSFLYNSLKTVPKTGPSGGPVFGASFDAF